MKKTSTLILTCLCLSMSAQAADLLQVYNQALNSDPIYQQAISQQLSTNEGVPISLASLLPNINVTVNPSITRSGYAGANTAGIGFFPRNNTARAYDLQLNATQTIFNYSQFMAYKSTIATSKAADATLNAALQDLMVRVANAYFAVLQAEEELSYSEASKRAYAEQLHQIKQQYNVGLKTVTELYTAQSSYDSSVAEVIAAQTKLANDRENLRVITGTYYPRLSRLSESFPLVSPKPRDIEKWVDITQQQNWQIKAAQYNVSAARQTVRQQYGGHMPTVSLQGTVDRQYVNNDNPYNTIAIRRGTSTETDKAIMFNIAMPLYAGGSVTAETNQAIYNMQTAEQQLEQTTRNSINTARQSYLGIVAGISQISADKAAIKSAISSLDGMEASYQVGTETLVNVLNQQEKVLAKQTAYTKDRYQFVNDLFALKQAAGTLSFNDMRAINAWLIDTKLKANTRTLSLKQKTKKHLAKKQTKPSIAHKKRKNKRIRMTKR